MEKEQIITELDSLITFVQNQGNRHRIAENEHALTAEESARNTFLSDLHAELNTMLVKVKNKFLDKGLAAFMNDETPISDSPAQETTTNDAPKEVTLEQAVESLNSLQDSNSQNDENRTDENMSNAEPVAKPFAEMSFPEKLAFYLKGRIEHLNGTGPEWDEVKEWLNAQLNVLVGHETNDELVKNSVEAEKPGEKKKVNAPAKKVAKKKAAKKKAARKK